MIVKCLADLLRPFLAFCQIDEGKNRNGLGFVLFHVRVYFVRALKGISDLRRDGSFLCGNYAALKHNHQRQN